MKGTFLYASIIICSLLLACAGTHSNNTGTNIDGKLITPRNLNDITDIEWNLTRMTKDDQEIALVQGSKATFTCDQDGKVTGKATINRYSGDLKLMDDGEILWSKAFIMTRMAGPPQLMQQEADFTQALMQTSRIILSGSKLVLKSSSGSTVLEFHSAHK